MSSAATVELFFAPRVGRSCRGAVRVRLESFSQCTATHRVGSVRSPLPHPLGLPLPPTRHARLGRVKGRGGDDKLRKVKHLLTNNKMEYAVAPETHIGQRALTRPTVHMVQQTGGQQQYMR